MIITKNKKIFLVIFILIVIFVMTFLIRGSYAIEPNDIKVDSKEFISDERDLYRNQYFVNNTSLSDTVLSTNITGKNNFTHLNGPGNSTFIGFSKENNTDLSYSNVSGAAHDDSEELYSIYKFNINLLPGSNVETFDPFSLSCRINSSSDSCKINMPEYTPKNTYSSAGWSTTNGATTGIKAGNDYEVTNNNVNLYANGIKKHTVVYLVEAGSAGGNIDGDDSELVADGESPIRDFIITSPEGEQLNYWYSINTDITLKNGKEIKANNPILHDEILQIVVKSDLYLFAKFKEIEYKIGTCDWVVEQGTLKIYSSSNNSCIMDKTIQGEHPWKNYYNNITSVVISPNVIANPDSSYLFSNLTNVTTIDLSNLDTSNVTNMSHMFESDKNLRTVSFPASFVNSTVTDTSSMFKDCENVTSLDLTSFDTSNITNMKEMFNGCTGLTEIQVDTSKFKTNNVTDVTNMFKDTIISKEAIDNLLLDTSGVTMELSFSNKKINITEDYNDSNKSFDLIKPENGGSGRYTYEISSIEPTTEGININNDKLIINNSVLPGTYEVKIVIKDIVRTGIEDEIIYNVTIKDDVIETPQLPSLNNQYGENIVYKSNDIKLTCTSNSSYNNGEVSHFEFGYSSDINILPSEWTEFPNGIYTISKTSQEIGTKYYFCRERATKGNKTSDYSVSSPVKISITNAIINFDITNGGTLSGKSTLYVRYGESDVFSSLYGSETDHYPTASMNGYEFKGFYTQLSKGQKVINPDGSLEPNVTGYTSNGKWVITKKITLYAQYKKDGDSDDEESYYYGSIGTLRGFLSKYKVVTLIWSKTPGAYGYQVCYKKSSDKSYKCYNNGSLKGVILNAGTKYDFRVSPYIKNNGKIIISPNGKTVSLYTLKKMDTPKVTKVNSKKVKIKYTKIKGVTGYKVYYSTKKNKGYKLIKTLGSNKSSFNFKPKKGKKYYYRIRAYKVDNNKKVYSPLSNAKKYKLK